MANEETNKSPYILGLDIGINSIGWAIVSCKKKGKEVFSGYEPTSLVALNSRIFEEMIDREKRSPKTKKDGQNVEIAIAEHITNNGAMNS